MSAVRVSCLALPLLLAACTVTVPSRTITTKPTASCDKDQTLTRTEYDGIIARYNERRGRDFTTMSQKERTGYWTNSAELISLFKNGKTVCVTEPGGGVSTYTWSEHSVEAEKDIFSRLTKLVLPGNPGTERGRPSIAAPAAPSTQTSTAPAPAVPSSPSTRPTLARPIRTSPTEEVKSFIAEQVKEARRLGQISIMVESAQAYRPREGVSDQELLESVRAYYKNNSGDLDQQAVVALTGYVKNFTSGNAKHTMAAEEPALKPVLQYFKSKYGEDLSNVLVVAAPLSSIPHTGGTGTFATALGLFVAPIEIPIQISFRLPMKHIDTLAREGAYVSGTLQIKLQNQMKIQREAMRRMFGTERLIHMDPKALSRNGANSSAVEAVAAHELRHLLDYFDCPSVGAELCEPEKLTENWNATVRKANAEMDAHHKAFMAHPRTLQTQAELRVLMRKYRPSQDEDERERWIQNNLLSFFNSNYKLYPHFFSIKEQRGYKEQLSYLLARGQSRAEAIQTVLRTALPDHQSVSMDGTTETVTVPGLPWVEDLYARLIEEQSKGG